MCADASPALTFIQRRVLSDSQFAAGTVVSPLMPTVTMRDFLTKIGDETDIVKRSVLEVR